jgi:hypothetical protein
MMPLKNETGRAVGPARAHRDRHQPRGAAVDVALARVVGDQVLADQLLVP